VKTACSGGEVAKILQLHKTDGRQDAALYVGQDDCRYFGCLRKSPE
jgi:hypothetical protein